MEQIVNYLVCILYEKWMNGVELELQVVICGCVDCQKEENSVFIICVNLECYVVKFVVVFVFFVVEVVKNCVEEGCVYLDFLVNQMNIYFDYCCNLFELVVIKYMVDVVKNDVNIIIIEIVIVGYVFFEGRYVVNVCLVQGCVEVLKSYVMNEYGFKVDLFKVNFVFEDWVGLCVYVVKNDLLLKEEILFIIDKNESDFDVKEECIKVLDGGKVYVVLLQDCYLVLCYFDYIVCYVVCGFDVEEVKQIIKFCFQQLSLQEMFLVV